MCVLSQKSRSHYGLVCWSAERASFDPKPRNYGLSPWSSDWCTTTVAVRPHHLEFELTQQLLKYKCVKKLVSIVTILAKIKSRLKSRNACYHSVQDLLSYSLLSKNTKIKIYRTIILLLFCVGVKLGLSH
jgi:hypothetical protein